MEADRDQIKKTIRALLISAKNGLSPQQLLRDYAKVIGTPFPLEELGYKTLTEAIHAMPDVVRVMKTFSGRVILRGVPDASSRHIASLVAKQRSSKPYSDIKASSNPPSSSKRTVTPSSCVPHKAKQVPSSFEIKMRQLMLAHQEGLPLLEFQEVFHRRFGYYVNITSWGFTNITQAFESMKDVVKLVYEDTLASNGRKCLIMPSKKG